MAKDKETMDISNNNGPYIDRSKLKILLCDQDTESSQEVSNLLTKSCYQVISVSSAVEVINALNSEGPYIDLILAAVDLPINTSMKMVKYIMQDKNFHHIPVIMLSTQDEAFLIHKYLKLGATDYLVKPLCKNEILNLWMHTRKKRRVNNILNFDLGHLVTSEATMNKIIFLEDTNNKFFQTATPKRVIQISISKIPELFPLYLQ